MKISLDDDNNKKGNLSDINSKRISALLKIANNANYSLRHGKCEWN